MPWYCNKQGNKVGIYGISLCDACYDQGSVAIMWGACLPCSCVQPCCLLYYSGSIMGGADCWLGLPKTNE